ncbi:hypothetical protein [Halococcus thailandensis]|uniref:DUF8160 domain-containing protein n=1 Tax=Halococcus thailandensis JCM 13552 TaxID=1227457 RepID=M0NG06_9EURY|nr:hypothetical protein [Halococcus thailandensis]EMA56791.1 hypothetical protein C451_00255 [Halococcus thailandensis JCM 13552]
MGDRADRLSSRRKDRQREEKPEQPAEQEQQEDPQSAKDLYQGTYMYLPEDLRQEFDLVASEMDTQRQRRNGKQVEKIRHFEPLVVSLGLEAIENMDDDELEERLAEFDP